MFYPWGNWDAATFDKSMTGNVGVHDHHAGDRRGPGRGDVGRGYRVRCSVEVDEQDAAAQFLNFLSSDEARQIAIDNGFMPTGLASQPAPKIKAGLC